MKKLFVAFFAIAALAAGSWAVTVNQSGGGDFTSVQAALDSGATEIIITDSAVYDENIEIGSPSDRGTPVTLTSNQTGDNRPVLASTTTSPIFDSVRNAENTGSVGVFSDGTVISNLIIKGNPDLGQYGQAALFIMADNVTIENCKIYPLPSALGQDIKFPTSLIFVAQEGDPGSHVAKANGKTSDGLLIKDCEILSVSDEGVAEPTVENLGFLQQGENSNAATFARCDHYTDAGQDVVVTFDGCSLRYIYDAGLFPSNRDNDGAGGGSVTWVMRNCFLDACGKFGIRSRGCNLIVEDSIFTRTNQGNHGDSENSAVCMQDQDGRVDISATVTNCLFVNCGGAYSKKAYYGGVNVYNAGDMTVSNCTFDLCLSGASVGTGTPKEGAVTRCTLTDCVFDRMGYNAAPALDSFGIPLADSADLVDGLYAAWDWGFDNFDSGAPWSAAFNHYQDNEAVMVVNGCLVGEIASEDTRTWDEVVATGTDSGNVLGSRLYCGVVEGLDTVTRGTPQFENTDIDSDTPYAPVAGAPNDGIGANIGGGSSVQSWSVY